MYSYVQYLRKSMSAPYNAPKMLLHYETEVTYDAECIVREMRQRYENDKYADSCVCVCNGCGYNNHSHEHLQLLLLLTQCQKKSRQKPKVLHFHAIGIVVVIFHALSGYWCRCVCKCVCKCACVSSHFVYAKIVIIAALLTLVYLFFCFRRSYTDAIVGSFLQ